MQSIPYLWLQISPMRLFFLTLLICASGNATAQTSYWQQEVRYTIDAELNTTEKSITGFETIHYKNNSPDELSFIWFHIWPNAYLHDSTALRLQIRSDSARAEKAINAGTGSIERLDFKVDGRAAATETHPNPQYVDVIKVLLPEPLLPGDSVAITTPFKVLLPPYFSRSGYAGTQIMACQWYPKPAVYDQAGWHEFPYLDMGEFYSEFGDFTVTLTVPAEYVVGATGVLQTEDELQRYKKLGKSNFSGQKKKVALYRAPKKKSKKTLTWHATNVPDFAWFADIDFVIQYDTIMLRSGAVIDAFSYYHNQKETIWTNSISYIKDAVKKYSGWIGDYEYPTVQVVEGPANSASGGMEYPMITLITSPDATVEELDGVITHEIGHNWFMSMLGSNERAHTWMDEGLNTYYQFRYEAEKYRWNSVFGESVPQEIRQLPSDQFLNVIYTAVHENLPMTYPMDIPADQFPDSNEYGIVSYIKTALWMYILEASLGRERVDAAVQHYFTKWKHKHPQPADMQAAFEEALGVDLDGFFELTRTEGNFDLGQEPAGKQ